MAIFKQDMSEMMMNAGCLHKIDVHTATHKGGDLLLMFGDAKAAAEYFYDSNLLDTDARDEARFFVMADYLTCIPYGSSGYAAFESMLKEAAPGMTVAEYRFERLKERVGKRLTWLDDGQLAYIKYFFENYNKEIVNLKIPAEVASLICRFHHECEANYRRDVFPDGKDVDDVTLAFSNRLAELYEENDTVDARQFLSEIPAYGELTETELRFIRKVTGLDEA